jgi:long-chain acyl-CoA synthetase
MIEWWGPILFDYYSGTEGAGVCAITSPEWLTHKGSVGRAVLGELHIMDEDGTECPPGVSGSVYFANGPAFEYHNDPGKSAAARDHRGWTTLGDIGFVDDEGYLYLTDRRAFVIISGGVNIYPQEIEDVLVLHPDVTDVAVFGVPNEDMVEETKAVVQPRDMSMAGPEFEQALIEYCRARLASYKCPRSIDFTEELPRAQTGKLYKQQLRQTYWDRSAASS